MVPTNDDIGQTLTFSDGPYNPVVVDLGDLSGDVVTTSIEKTITSNGREEITPLSEGVDADAFSSVILDVRVLPKVTPLEVTITENTTTAISPPEGYDGLSSVTVYTQIPQPQPTPLIQIISMKTGSDAHPEVPLTDMTFYDHKETIELENGGGLVVIYKPSGDVNAAVVNYTNYPPGSSFSTSSGRYYYVFDGSLARSPYFILKSELGNVVRLYDANSDDTNNVSTRFFLSQFEFVGLAL